MTSPLGPRRLFVAAVVLIAAVVGSWLVWRVVDRDPDPLGPDVHPTAELVTRSEYLTRAADCAACHTAPGGKPFSGGLAFKLPFSTIYSTNITADRETGIGTWSDDDFVRALHRGIAKDGTHLYPAFPYTSYTGLSRDDAVAIKAYLFSLPPEHAPARPADLTFPFNQRWTMLFWNLAFLDEHRFRPDPAQSAEVNRGAYLATALGHCGECHTPRNIAFALRPSKQFAGTILQGWYAYNISPDKQFGIGGWSDTQVADYLGTGHAEVRGSAAGPMGEAVSNSLQYLSPHDITALVEYLRTVQPQPGAANATSAPAAEKTADDPGGRIFEGACAGRHEWDGQGRETPYAALAGSQTVSDPKGLNLIQVLLSGASLQVKGGTIFMPSFASAYSDAELAAVANYVIEHFGGKTGQATAEDIRKGRSEAEPVAISLNSSE
jgi:mono/diheme cytochrome c family protein